MRLLDSRFDVQVRQSLPFMDFSTAKWEMLLGVRNFFREAAADQSVFDELLVVRPAQAHRGRVDDAVLGRRGSPKVPDPQY